MKLSTRTRYGMRLMHELATSRPGQPVSVKQVAERQEMSAKYLEQIVAVLKAAGLLEPVRGMYGGYILARPPSEITLGEIFGALEGSTSLAECVEDPDTCPRRDACATRDLWVRMEEALAGVLDGTTLEDLAGQKK